MQRRTAFTDDGVWKRSHLCNAVHDRIISGSTETLSEALKIVNIQSEEITSDSLDLLKTYYNLG